MTDVVWMNSHSTMRWAQIYVIAFGLTLVLVYAAQLRRILHDATDGRQLWPDLVLVAGIIFVATELATSGVTATVFVLAAHNHDYAIAHLANFVVTTEDPLGLWRGPPHADQWCRHLGWIALPRWVGIVSVLIGIVCVLGPIGFLGMAAAFFLWFPGVGFVVAAEMDSAIDLGWRWSCHPNSLSAQPVLACFRSGHPVPVVWDTRARSAVG